MAKFALISRYLANRNHHYSQQTQNTQPLRLYSFLVENYRQKHDNCVECIKFIQQECCVGCKRLQENFNSENPQEYSVDLGDNNLVEVESF